MKNVMILNLGSHFGGTEKYILNIVKNINLNEYNIHICGKKDTKFIEEIKKEKININIHEIEFCKKSIFKSIKKIKQYIIKNNINIIHSNGITSDLVCNIARKRVKDVKIISTVHGFSSFDRMDRSKVEIKVFDILEKLLFKYNDHYISVSNALRDYLVNRGLPTNKVDVIYHAVNNIKDEKYKENFSNDVITLGSVGRLEKVKGYDILINSIKDLKSKNYKFNCILIGEGSEYDSLMTLAKEIGIEDCIEFLGYKEDIYTYIDKMDIYIQPSRQESFGISIIEAMNKVKPIIASKVGGVCEIIEDEKNGLLFQSLDSNELSNKIEELINNKEKRKYLALEGKKSLVERFSMKIFIENLEQVYRKV